MNKITPLSPHTGPSSAHEAKKEAPTELSKLAGEFEGIFLRQLLQSSEIIGKSAGGYGAMAVDALASGIEKGGGLGLARQIEDALGKMVDSTRSSHQAPSAPTGSGRRQEIPGEVDSSTGRFVRSPR